MKGPFCLVIMVSMLCSHAHAASSPCHVPPENSQVTFSAESGQNRSFDIAPNSDVSLKRYHFSIYPRARDRKVTVGYGHQYSIVDIDTLFPSETSPVANGHLHTLYVPIDLAGEAWQLRLQPALSVSSNLLKKPGNIGADAWQPNVALLRQFGDSPESGWVAGFCGDHRFGDYRVYPSISWNRQHGRWSLRIGWPDTAIKASIRESLSTGLRIGPAGNRWFVHDSDAGDSLFIHEAWRAEWYLDWRFARSWRVNMNLGKLLENRYEFELENGAWFQDDTDSPLQARVGIIWHF